MTFAFEIISAHQIHRHPGESYYRHWTFLIGKLLSPKHKSLLPLSEISEAIPYLQQLLTHPNIKLVSRAIKVLSRKGLYPKFY